MNIAVRKANSYDAEMISLIGKISFRKAFGNVFDKNNLEEYLKNVYKPDKIEVSINRENNAWFVAEFDDRPVGFAKVRKFSLNDEIESVSQMQLEKIYVLPEYQGSGAGSRLLDEVLNLALELSPDYIWLDVYASNEKAMRKHMVGPVPKCNRVSSLPIKCWKAGSNRFNSRMASADAINVITTDSDKNISTSCVLPLPLTLRTPISFTLSDERAVDKFM